MTLLLNLLATAGLLCVQAPVPDTPLPDPVALMKEVQAHQKQMDELRENYTFHRIRRVEELDGKGEVKKTTTVEREVFYVNGRQIARLIRNGDTPLTPEEDKKEQERVRKLTIEEAQRFHELYQRTAADLARVAGFAAETESMTVSGLPAGAPAACRIKVVSSTKP